MRKRKEPEGPKNPPRKGESGLSLAEILDYALERGITYGKAVLTLETMPRLREREKRQRAKKTLKRGGAGGGLSSDGYTVSFFSKLGR